MLKEVQEVQDKNKKFKNYLYKKKQISCLTKICLIIIFLILDCFGDLFRCIGLICINAAITIKISIKPCIVFIGNTCEICYCTALQQGENFRYYNTNNNWQHTKYNSALYSFPIATPTNSTNSPDSTTTTTNSLIQSESPEQPDEKEIKLQEAFIQNQRKQLDLQEELIELKVRDKKNKKKQSKRTKNKTRKSNRLLGLDPEFFPGAF